MKTNEIAERLVARCREAKWEVAQNELYSADAVSIEAQASPGSAKETRGLPAIIEKGRKFTAMVVQMHSLKVSDPLVADASFACTMSLDVTMEGQGRMQMTELCVYEVKDENRSLNRRFLRCESDKRRRRRRLWVFHPALIRFYLWLKNQTTDALLPSSAMRRVHRKRERGCRDHTTGILTTDFTDTNRIKDIGKEGLGMPSCIYP